MLHTTSVTRRTLGTDMQDNLVFDAISGNSSANVQGTQLLLSSPTDDALLLDTPTDTASWQLPQLSRLRSHYCILTDRNFQDSLASAMMGRRAIRPYSFYPVLCG